MVNIFSPCLALVLAGWIVAVSGLWAGGGRVCRANWRAAPLLPLPIPARNMILAMNPLDSRLPVSSIQSQIGAVEVRIEGVQAQIAEVAESVKEVQRQVVEVGAKIEKTEAALDAADLSSEKRVILVMKLKSLMDKEKGLMDEKKGLMDKEKGLMDEKKILMNKEGLMVKIESNDYFISLQDAKLNGRVLCVGGTQHSFSHELYVRDCWVEMYEVMEDMLKSGCQRIVVTGTPGIGKSQFLQYCMWRMAQKNEAFLHETYPQMVHMYSPGNFATHNYNNIPSGLPYLVDLEAETLPFYDYAKWQPRFTAIFSSPNPYRFKSIIKMDNSVELIMPPWENEEIFDAHKLISKFRSVDIDLVKSQLAIYGGVPRYVFDKSKEGSRPMKQALRSKGQLVAERMFMVDWVESGKDVDMSYTISHMIPEDTVKFTGRLFSPASTFVLENLMETHSAIVLEKVLQIVRMKENAGCLFEFVASRFALADKTHNASRLESESASKSSNSATSRTFTVGNFVSLPPEWRNGKWMPKQDVLYYQNKVNLQSVDAFTIIDRELVFFQLTIGSQHSVKAKGLSDILNLFSRGGGGLDMVDTCSLIFVVPPDSKMEKVQPLLNSDNKVYSSPSKIPSALQHLATNQFIIHVDLDKVKFPRKPKHNTPRLKKYR